MRRDRGAVVTRRALLSSVVASQADLHARFGGVVPEVASRRHLELIHPWFARRSTTPGSARGRRPRRRDAGPASSARCSSASRPPRRSRGHAVSRSSPSTTSRATSRRSTRRPTHSSLRSRACSRGGPHAPAVRSATGHRSRSSARRSTTLRARRSTRCAAARARLSGGAEIDRLARGRPRGSSVARAPGSTLVLGPQDGVALRRPRAPRSGHRCARADLAASYQRAIVRALVGRLEAAAERTGHTRLAVVGGVAANSELRAALPDARFAPRALHRQRRDDRVRRAVRTTPHNSRLPCPGCVLVRADLTGRPRRCSRSSLVSGALLAAGGARPRPRSRPAPRAGRASSAAARCPSSAAAGSSSSAPRRSPTGCGRRGASEVQMRSGRRPPATRSGRSRGSRSAASPFSPSSPTCAS